MDDQTSEETPEREETIEDLDVPDEQAEDLKGGIIPPEGSPQK
jgi:hypothetical protein